MIYKSVKVRWLDRRDIESVAGRLTKQILSDRKPFSPVNVEKIILYVQRSLDKNLVFEVDNIGNGLDGKYELADKGKLITINERVYDSSQELLEHVIGHELGHYYYHTDYLKQLLHQQKLLGAAFPSTSMRRLFSNYDDAEWQADYFSGALRLPKEEVEAKHYSLFDKLGILGKFKDNSSLYRYIGEDGIHTTLEQWAKEFGVTSFSLSVRLFHLGVLDAGGRSYISYDRKTGNIIEGFAC